MTAASDMDCLPAQGEIQSKGSTGSGMAFNPDFSRVLLDDSVGDRKAESRAAVLAFSRHVLRREKRIVDALDMFRRNARASVGHLNAYRIAIAADHAQRSSARHGILCVEK